MNEYVVNIPVHLTEQDVIDNIEGQMCRLPPFCIDAWEMDEVILDMALRGALGEQARLAASKADCEAPAYAVPPRTLF